MSIIQFTDNAVKAIEQFRNHLQIPENYGLRVGIRQKNESSKRLLIGFDEKKERDKEEVIQGQKVIYTPGEVFFFAGMVIDYVEEESRKGFTFVEQKSVSI